MEVLTQKHFDSKECIPLHGPIFKQIFDGEPSYHCTRMIESNDDISQLVKNEIIPYIQDIDDPTKTWEKFQSLFDTKSIAKRPMLTTSC